MIMLVFMCHCSHVIRNWAWNPSDFVLRENARGRTYQDSPQGTCSQVLAFVWLRTASPSVIATSMPVFPGFVLRLPREDAGIFIIRIT